MICYSQNGHFRRTVSDDYVAQEGEVLFEKYPEDKELKKAFPGYATEIKRRGLLAKIRELENTQTPRMIREHTLGLDTTGKLEELENNIAALRKKYQELA